MSAGGMLRPAGPEARALAEVMHTALGVCALAFVLAMGCLAAALWWKGRRPVATAFWLWGGGLVLPVLVFGGLLLHGERRARGLDEPAPAGALRVTVTGHLWWWSLVYSPEHGVPGFAAANELRVPVGRPVALTLASDDVIHSYWVPALGGKVDLVPGRLNRLTFTADRPGVYRGPCSEYCGTQHAAMVLQVVAMPPAFEVRRWARTSPMWRVGCGWARARCATAIRWVIPARRCANGSPTCSRSSPARGCRATGTCGRTRSMRWSSTSLDRRPAAPGPSGPWSP